MPNKLIVVTGKSGIGKTLILKSLKIKNTIYLDDVIKNEMYIKGHKVFKKLEKKFGNKIIINDKIDTSILGRIVLNDNIKFKKLNSIVLPFIQKKLIELKNKDSFIIEMASYINYEKDFKDFFDYVILMTRKKFYLDEKFNYIDKKMQLIKNNKIKFDELIDLDKNRNTILIKRKILKMLS